MNLSAEAIFAGKDWPLEKDAIEAARDAESEGASEIVAAAKITMHHGAELRKAPLCAWDPDDAPDFQNFA
jgi:O-succinylbenzoate synthase